jgi:hypothetical protein
MNRRAWLVRTAAVLLLSACARTGTVGTGAPSAPKPSAPAAPPSDRTEQQADDALARWNKAFAAAKGRPPFVPIGELTQQLGDWEPSMGGDGKLALGSGALRAAALASTAPPAGAVRWSDGATVPVPLVSAADSFARIVKEGQGDCGTCTPLEITGAALSTVDIGTSRGTATVPAWIYTVRGTAVRIARVAVDPTHIVTVTPPPWNSLDTPDGTSVDGATVNADGRRLTLRFTGASDRPDDPCGADYTARVVEADTAVVAIIDEHRHGNTPVACTAVGYGRTAAVDLSRPLGDRAVLEIRQGMPVVVTKA